MITIHLGGVEAAVDPGRLTPVARALAEAIHDAPGRAAVDVWMENDRPIRDTVPDWQTWYTPDEADQPDRMAWRGWSTQPLGGQDPHARLEYEATKIPPGWHVLGTGPTRELTTEHVLTYLRKHGRAITPATWRSYVGRDQAPKPSKWVGRTPIWYLDDIDEWIATRPAAKAQP